MWTLLRFVYTNAPNKVTTIINAENEVRIGKTTRRKTVEQNEVDETDPIGCTSQ